MSRIEIVLQLAAGGLAIARIATDDYRRSRTLACAAQTAIAGDFLVKFVRVSDPIFLVGVVYSSLVTLRTGLVLLPVFDRSRHWRIILCLVVLAAVWTLMLLAAGINDAATSRFIIALPFVAPVFGAVSDITNRQQIRRGCFLAAGCVLSVFAIETNAWGLLAKSLISDVGASLYYFRGRS